MIFEAPRSTQQKKDIEKAVKPFDLDPLHDSQQQREVQWLLSSANRLDLN